MDEIDAENVRLVCCDCGREYGDDGWIDVMMTNEQWHAITNGLGHAVYLCGACMIVIGGEGI